MACKFATERTSQMCKEINTVANLRRKNILANLRRYDLLQNLRGKDSLQISEETDSVTNICEETISVAKLRRLQCSCKFARKLVPSQIFESIASVFYLRQAVCEGMWLLKYLVKSDLQHNCDAYFPRNRRVFLQYEIILGSRASVKISQVFRIRVKGMVDYR